MRARRVLGDRAGVAGGFDGLSQRERQVFALLILGHTNPEIAEQLYLSVRTVESHRANVQRKLGAATRADLVQVALAAGVLIQARPGAGRYADRR